MMTLLDQLKPLIDVAKVVSFDIFDTLLIRPYVRPEDLFLHLEYLEKKKGFYSKRKKAEERARRQSSCEEVTLDEIYALLPKSFQQLKSKEMALEEQVLRARSDVKEVFLYAKKKKKKIILISDIYLSKEFIGKILAKNGFKGLPLFVSSDFRKSKRTGTLYDEVIKKLKIDPAKILHIGDNFYTDGIKATERGVCSFIIPKMIELFFKENERAKEFWDKQKNLETSVLFGLLAQKQERAYWENIGFTYAGPALYAYTYWLYQKLAKDKQTDALFVARDGWTLKKIFESFPPIKVKPHYVYAPRGLKYFLDFYHQGGRELSKNALDYLFEKVSGKGVKEISQKKKKAVLQMHADVLCQTAETELKAYQRYLQGFSFGKKCALIDSITEGFSSQKLLSYCLKQPVSGYYWTVQKKACQTNYSLMKNVSCFQQAPKNRFKQWNIMELFMSAPTPPVQRIEKGPVFVPLTPEEQERIKIYPALEQGILDFVALVKDFFGAEGFLFSETLVCQWINAFCVLATPEDRQMFSCVKHASGVEHNQYRPCLKFKPLFYWENTFYLMGIPILKFKRKGKV